MTTMRPTTSTVSRAVSGLLVAAVAAIVLGIIGMHALNAHGAMPATDHAAMTMPMAGDTSAQVLGNDSTAVTVGVAGEGNGHDMGDMVMLCAAMLAAASALILLTFGLRRIPRVWARLTAAPTTVTRWVTARLATGPPPVWDFSVIRC